MASATAAQVAAMNAKQEEVRAALEQADKAAEKWRRWPGTWTRTAAQEGLLKNLEVLRGRYKQWTDETSVMGWRRWALQGYDASGSSYPVSLWLRIGNDFLSELIGKGRRADGTEDVGLCQLIPEAGSAAVVGHTLDQSAADVAEFSRKAKSFVTDPWPLKWKLGLGAIGALATLGLVAVIVIEARPILNLLPTGERER